MTMMEELSCFCSQKLQYLIRFLPPAALYSSGIALGLPQDASLLAVIIPAWAVSATITLLTSKAVLMAANFGHISVVLAFLSLVHSLLNYSKNEPFKDAMISWLRHYIMVTSLVAAVVVALAIRTPSNSNSQYEPLLVERPNPLASEARTRENHLHVGEKPILEVLPRQDTLSDIESVAFGNMGPGSTCPSNSSDGTEMSLPPVGRVKSALSQKMVQLSTILNPAKPSKDDDGST